MPTHDPRIDAYIEKSAAFARPILVHLRNVVHRACPQVEETMKWNFPHFMHHGMLCAMAAFKQHCTFGFWKESLVLAGTRQGDGDAMGQFGRITSVKELPAQKVLAAYVRKAMQLNEAGIKSPRAKPGRKPPLAIPEDMSSALKKNRKAATTFAGFSPSQQREYVEWIGEAKRDETRAVRLATTIQWLSEGKQRNWKYMNC
ncbi:MAG: YdeI/OmpD-associated family protein [Rudaea sp.]|nr:YdeI/OmpD-associated family protein [Rudaea sp.]